MDEKKKKILIVEDDTFILELLVAELQRDGFEVQTALTGTDAIVKFKEMRPDLILLDILLPDKNGFDALREIRREPEGREVKVMVLSNFSDTPHIEEAQRLGVIEDLVKAQYVPQEIAEKIKKALG